MDENMVGWVDGWKDGWRTDGWSSGWLEGWMGGWEERWIEGWLDGWEGGMCWLCLFSILYTIPVNLIPHILYPGHVSHAKLIRPFQTVGHRNQFQARIELTSQISSHLGTFLVSSNSCRHSLFPGLQKCREVYLKLLRSPLLATRREPDWHVGRGEAGERKKNEERRRNRGGGRTGGHHISPQCETPVELLDCPGTGANEFPLSDLTQLELCLLVTRRILSVQSEGVNKWVSAYRMNECTL